MGTSRKRQRLSENGTAAVIVSKSDQALPAADSAKTAQLYVRALPADTTDESLADHFSQSFPIKHAVVVTDKETGRCKGYGFVTFTDPEDAARALEEFNGADFNGNKLKVSPAERRHREDGPTLEEKNRTGKGESTPQLSSKLIIRNLPWSVNTPEKLTKLFLSFGKINQAILPKDHQGQLKGFGIVMLRGRKNAELALERLNGKEVDGRTLAVDWAVDRETWEKAQAEEKAATLKEAKENSSIAKSDERVDSGQSEEEKDEAMREGDDEDGSDQDVEDEDDEVSGSVLDADEDDEDEDAEEYKKPQMTSNEATLFIRNLPFTTVDEDLAEHFEDFGPVRYARVVMDHATERSRGTGFVCFRSKGDADACLKGAPQPVVSKDNGKKKKDPNSANGPSILENELADPSRRYTLEGRVLQLTRAVEKSEADRLTAEGTASRNKRDRDKRRLYLLGEGTIPSNSPMYQKLSATEVSMRDASAKQRRKLIDSNPSLHLSLTRLSIRNIPRNITSKDLKDLAREAVVGFAKDVKEGRRQRLSKEELARGAEEMHQAEKERKQKGKGLVKQAKIIFEGSEGGKVDEGSGRSRGYGFVEYHTHRSALMGLRWLNGHSVDYQAKEKKAKASKEDAQDRKKRLIVEFAIENAQVVKRRKDKEVKAREKPKTTTATQAKDDVRVQELEKPSRPLNKKRKRDSSALDKSDRQDNHSKSKDRKMIAKRQAKRGQRKDSRPKA